MDIINLRSDTQTLPTQAMRKAIYEAELGDDTYHEDPTVTKFQALAAEKLGTEAALLTISGHMANLVALMVHGRPGDEVVIDRESHIFYYELGAMASVAGLMPMPVPSCHGLLDPDDVRAAILAELSTDRSWQPGQLDDPTKELGIELIDWHDPSGSPRAATRSTAQAPKLAVTHD